MGARLEQPHSITLRCDRIEANRALARYQQRTPLIQPCDGFHQIELVGRSRPPNKLSKRDDALRCPFDDATLQVRKTVCAGAFITRADGKVGDTSVLCIDGERPDD